MDIGVMVKKLNFDMEAFVRDGGGRRKRKAKLIQEIVCRMEKGVMFEN